MCLAHENRAEVSAHYINSQLRSLWESSQSCVERHGKGLKPTRSDLEYGSALAEFYFGKHNRYRPSKDDLSFYASFGCPRVEFVCNHEAIFYLKVKEGHYHVDTTKKILQASEKHNFSGYKVAFRLDYTTVTKKVTCEVIGNADAYDLNLVVLNTSTAEYCDHLSVLPDITTEDMKTRHATALTHYLRHYLDLLKRAGHLVFHSLPDFDNLTRAQIIDYSTATKRALTTTEVFGINIAEVNTFLKGLWLQAAVHIDEHGTGDNHSAYSSFYLAEHRSVWTEGNEDVQFHAFFGPLQVEALCKREVVVYLDVQDVHFFMGGFKETADHKFSDWKIALIVDLTFEESEAGAVRKLKLDLSTARFCEHLSTLKAEFNELELLQRLRTTLIRYITVRYLTILQEAGHHYVYHKDTRIIARRDDSYDSGSEDFDEELGCWCEDEADCGHTYVHGHVYWGRIFKERLAHPHQHDYDLVTAVSQGSLNKHWRALWEIAFRKAGTLGLHDHQIHHHHSRKRELEERLELCLADYIFEHDGHVHFACSFGAPQVQLLCAPGSQKVVIYFQLKEGYMKTLLDKKYNANGVEHHFSDWTVAFEVDLKLRDSSKTHKVSDAILKQLGRTEHEGFKQLILDFSTARFSDTRSTTPGLLEGNDFRLIRSKREALLHYFIHHYFSIITVAGHNVLYTLPIFSNESHSLAVTSLAFQIIPFTFGPQLSYVEGILGRQRAVFDRNMIVFVGVTGHRPLPSTPLPHGGNWVHGSGKEVSLGTVSVSRKTFLEGRLLSLLARVNAQTTVVPSFSGVEDGQWILHLTTWDKHPLKQKRECRWKELSQHKEHALEFDWHHRDTWSYEHVGDDGSDGSYRVYCDTTNKLAIPTDAHGALSIRMSGLVVLKLSYEGSSKHWNTEVSARWSSTISLASDGAHGLKVHISPEKIVPEFVKNDAEGELGQSTFADAFAHLKSQLPAVISFDHVVQELKNSFEGVWSLLFPGSGKLCIANPTFNVKGDLILELKPHAKVSHKHHHRHQQQQQRQTSEAHNSQAKSAGWFRTITEEVKQVIESHSILSPPPNYSPPGSVRGTAKSGFFQNAPVAQSEPVEVLADRQEVTDAEAEL